MGTNHKICIGLPTNRGLKPKSLLSLLNVLNYSKLDYFICISTKGYTTAENRAYITAQAIKNNCTHIFFTDDDMIYEHDILEKLLKHDKDIVGAKYHVRRIVENGDVIEYGDEKSDTELFRCKALGGGMLLVKTDIYQKLAKPWYWYKVLPEGMITMSHDWWMCEKAREAGYEIWCDPTLQVGHLGDYEY